MRLEIPDPDAEIVWEMAYNLSPEWQGKGVGGAVLDAVIEGWLKWAGIESIKAVSVYMKYMKLRIAVADIASLLKR